MRKGRIVRAVLVSLAVVGMCLPETAMAAGSAAKPAVTDVALAEGGLLQGQVVETQTGAGVANVPVTLRTQDQLVANTTTDADGRFAVQGLRGGVHQVVAGESQEVYRFWSPGTAPPSAQSAAIIYRQAAGTTGSSSVPVTYTEGGALKMILANPIVIGGLIATAIAVPIALNNTHHHTSP